VIICPSCGTENQDHFRFCQGCGTDVSQVPRGSVPHEVAKTDLNIEALPDPIGTPAAPSALELPTPEPAPAPAPVAAAPSYVCASCGHTNEPGNVFCGACGSRMPPPSVSVPAPAAKAPSEPPRALDRTSLGGMSPLAAPPKPVRFSLTLLRVDGTDAGLYTCTEEHAVIGRETGGIFASDATLSPLHARFERRGDRLFVVDANSLNGVYRRLVRNVSTVLENGDGFRIGQEVLRFELVAEGDAGSDVQTLGSPRHGVRARVVSVVGRGDYGNASSIPATGLQFGRERGDVLFPEDGYVSGLHCKIHLEGNRAFLTDLGSSNGTFVRLRGEHELGANDVLLMGQQLFRVGIA
jgi:pSer/pThr/pTyr-binding forkhead associated (FHA) protein